MKAHLSASLEIAHQHLTPREFYSLLGQRQWLSAPTSEQRVAQCSGPLDADDEYFTLIWRTLASSRPELFGPRLMALSEQARGPSLAYLYEQCQHPELHREPGLASIAEDFNDALTEFRHYSVGPGCPDGWRGNVLSHIGLDFNIVQLQEGSVLQLLMQDRYWAAISLFCEPALRRTVLLAPTRRLFPDCASIDQPLLRLLLHEAIHSLLTLAALGEQSAPVGYLERNDEVAELSQLQYLVNEGVVELLMGFAYSCLVEDPSRTMAEVVSRPRTDSYTRAALAIAGRWGTINCWHIPALVEMGIANLRAADDNEVRRRLGRPVVAVVGHEQDSWLARLTNPEVPLKARFTSWDDRTHTVTMTKRRTRIYAPERASSARSFTRLEGGFVRVLDEALRSKREL